MRSSSHLHGSARTEPQTLRSAWSCPSWIGSSRPPLSTRRFPVRKIRKIASSLRGRSGRRSDRKYNCQRSLPRSSVQDLAARTLRGVQKLNVVNDMLPSAQELGWLRRGRQREEPGNVSPYFYYRCNFCRSITLTRFQLTHSTDSDCAWSWLVLMWPPLTTSCYRLTSKKSAMQSEVSSSLNSSNEILTCSPTGASTCHRQSMLFG